MQRKSVQRRQGVVSVVDLARLSSSTTNSTNTHVRSGGNACAINELNERALSHVICLPIPPSCSQSAALSRHLTTTQQLIVPPSGLSSKAACDSHCAINRRCLGRQCRCPCRPWWAMMCLCASGVLVLRSILP